MFYFSRVLFDLWMTERAKAFFFEEGAHSSNLPNEDKKELTHGSKSAAT